eukprot:1146482-Pelagomonas_calceolata.AAC.1
MEALQLPRDADIPSPVLQSMADNCPWLEQEHMPALSSCSTQMMIDASIVTYWMLVKQAQSGKHKYAESQGKTM